MQLPNANSLIYMQPKWQTVHSAWAEHLPAAFWLIEQLQPKSFVELGSHAGDSYAAFCQAIKALGLTATAMAVDTWEGDEHSHAYGPHILQALTAHHHPLYASFSSLNQNLFDTARAQVADGTVALLHIDGLHTYEAVKHDFESWHSAMSPCGVILFHDVSERKDDFGVWQLWDELTLCYPHLLLPHGHGLGILAVGTEVAKDFLMHLSPAGSTILSDSQQALITLLAALGQTCEQRRLQLVAQEETQRIQRDHDALAQNYSALESALEHARSEHHKTEAHLQAIEGSASWKATAPLRKLKTGQQDA